MAEIKEALEGLRKHFKAIALDWCGDVDAPTAHFQTVEKWVEATRLVNADLIESQAREINGLQGRLRATAQILIEEIGADGPKNAEESAREAVTRIATLTAERDRLGEEGRRVLAAWIRALEENEALTAVLEEAGHDLRRLFDTSEDLTDEQVEGLTEQALDTITKALTDKGKAAKNFHADAQANAIGPGTTDSRPERKPEGVCPGCHGYGRHRPDCESADKGKPADPHVPCGGKGFRLVSEYPYHTTKKRPCPGCPDCEEKANLNPADDPPPRRGP